MELNDRQHQMVITAVSEMVRFWDQEVDADHMPEAMAREQWQSWEKLLNELEMM